MNADRLRADLADLAEEVTPVDLRDQALRTSRRLVIQRRVATSAAALALVGVATGSALAIRSATGGLGPVPADSPSVTGGPSAGPAPTSSAPAPRGSAPSSSGSPAAGTSGPSRKLLTVAEVKNAQIPLPPWPGDACAAGTYQFRQGAVLSGSAPDSKPLLLMDRPSIADVDGDGEPEAVVTLTCKPGSTSAQQVIALVRGPAGLVPLGVVAPAGQRDSQVKGVQALADGSVRVRWVDTQRGSAGAEQWRTYRWNGSAFRQIAGPTGFPELRVDLKVTAVPLVLVKDPSGKYLGDLKVTVTNVGDLAVGRPELRLTLPAGVGMNTEIDGVGPIDPGRSRTLLYTLEATSPIGPRVGRVTVTNDLGDDDSGNDEAMWTVQTSES
ncbi:hypothetical protein AB0H57_06525 [Micromonospora sp. NPDC050686]|uniref:hypothetical protein n=1 Tax=Micromonospora sp. NPDC050686 TaxID=3154631 RepID=UPI0033FFD44A